MSVRASMTMRADVERDTTSTSNRWGTPDTPDFGEVGEIPCRAWSVQRRDVDDAGKAIVIEDLRAHVPADADVQEGDQLVNIRDRLGVIQFTGPLLVERIMRNGGPGSRPSHRTLMLRRHGGT